MVGYRASDPPTVFRYQNSTAPVLNQSWTYMIDRVRIRSSWDSTRPRGAVLLARARGALSPGINLLERLIGRATRDFGVNRVNLLCFCSECWLYD